MRVNNMDPSLQHDWQAQPFGSLTPDNAAGDPNVSSARRCISRFVAGAFVSE
jgi:hypothetical protein